MADNADLRLIDAARKQVHADGDGPALSTIGSVGTGIDAPVPSDSIAGYTLLRELHRGGQGVVYQAIQKSTQRKVAIKLLREGPFAGDADRARFEREVRVLGQLQHPNIVTIHDSGSSAGCYYLVMDYIPGQPLDVYIASGARSVRETLTLFATICEAVHAAHVRGVIHRDLKPRNIQIDEHGAPHVLDFGLAKVALGANEQAMTLTGQFVGSVPWAAPEQVEGAPGQIDMRTDVYSLGVILYQMLTRRFPYEVVGNIRDVFERIVRAEPVRPRAVRREIGDEVETIVLKCLSKERERRYQSAGALARDVRRYLAGEAIEAKADSGWYLMRKALRRNRTAVAIALTATLALLAVAATTTVLWQRAARAEEGERAARRAGERLIEYQSSMLTGIDPQAMGEQLRADLLRGVRESMPETAGHAAEDTERLLAAALTRIDLTGVAASLIAKQVLFGSAAALEETFRDDPKLELKMRHELSAILTRLGLFDQALQQELRALELARALVPPDEDILIVVMNDVGLLYLDLGDANAAEPLLREALERCDARYAPQDPRGFKALDNYAAVLMQRGRYEEAERLLRRSYNASLAALGAEHESTLSTQGSLAMVLKLLDRLEEAEPLQRGVVAANLATHGRLHPKTSLAYHNLASTLLNLRRIDDAEEAMREALDIRRAVHGDDHPSTIATTRGLAHALRRLERHAEALARFETVLRWRRERLPPNHPHLVDSLTDLARQRHLLGEFHAGEALALEAHQMLVASTEPAAQRLRALAEVLADLYEGWHQAEPRAGHDIKATEWRSRVETDVAATQPAAP